MEQNEKWKITLEKEESFNFTIQLKPTDFFTISITDEEGTGRGGGVVNLSTLIHMIKHVGILCADYKLWS